MAPARKRLADLLVIGYGNTLRGDDAVGRRVAEAIAARGFPGVEVLVCHLLTPELADPVSKTRAVVFVDAAVDGSPSVSLREIEPADTPQITAHAADPRILLALTRDVFGKEPRAWWLTIPVEDLEIGERLTETAQRGLALAVEKIEGLVREIRTPA